MAKVAKTMKPMVALKPPSLKIMDLGKGNSKAALSAAGASGTQMHRVPVDHLIMLPGFNIRADTPEYREGIEELKQSIMAEGFYGSKPLSVYVGEGDKLIIVDGHRRLTALKLANEEGAGIGQVPVVLTTPDTSARDLTVRLLKENQTARLTMLEQAVQAGRLLKDGMTVEETAERLGKSVRHVNDLQALINAPREIRKLVQEGAISATEALTHIRKNPEEAVAKLTDMAEKNKAKGDAKITRSTVAQAGVAAEAVKMVTTKDEFSAGKGDLIGYDTIEPYLTILGTDWFEMTKRKNEVRVLEPIIFKMSIRRAKKEEEEVVAEVTTTTPAKEKAAATAKVKAPRKAAAKAPAPVEPEEEEDDTEEEENDLLDDEEEEGPIPDLERAGVADRAEDAL